MNKIRVKEILSYIPRELIEEVESEMKINYQVKKITWNTMFVLLLMWMLDWKNFSLRTLEQLYSSPRFCSYMWKWKTKHTTISDRLINMDYRFFERLFEEISKKFIDLLDTKIIGSKFVLKKFDSTLVWLSEKLLSFWIKVWSPKEKHIKFTIWLEWLLPSKVNVHYNQEWSSEDIALWRAILEKMCSKDEILLFDRWVQKRDTYCNLIDDGKMFISRLKDKSKYKEIRKNKEVMWRKAWELILEEDLIVNLYKRGGKVVNKEIRLIKARKWNKIYLFITNMFDITAKEITEIYSKRWDIEVFFRFIKQEFWFSHFISRSKNWILSVLYMTLITSILVLVYKIKNEIKSYKEAKNYFVKELNELILIDIAISIWWDIWELKRRFLFYYRDW